MQNSQLIKVFRALSGEEQQLFQQFLESPFFNKKKSLNLLYQYLMEWRAGKRKNLDKQNVYKVLFPKKKYNDQQLRHLMSYLYKQLTHFLAYQEFTTNEMTAKLHLARAFRKRNLEAPFTKTLSEAEALLKKQPFRNIIYLQNKFDVELERYAHLLGAPRTHKKNLQEVADLLDKTYLAGRLRTACLQVSQQDVSQLEYDWGFLPEILSYIRLHPEVLDTAAVGIYYYYYMARKDVERAEVHFQSLLEVMFKHGDEFPAEDIRDIYLLAINYYASKVNKGDLKILRNSLDLYQFALGQGFLLSDGVLSRFTYKNVVSLATRLGDFEWAKSFNEAYKDKLELKHRESYYLYNLAKYHQEQGNYDKAMPLLQQLDSKDSMLMLGAKLMQIKMCYELEEWQALQAILESTKMYLFRRKEEMPKEHQAPFLNFLRITQKLLQINPLDATARELLAEEMKTTAPLPESAWLENRLNHIGT